MSWDNGRGGSVRMSLASSSRAGPPKRRALLVTAAACVALLAVILALQHARSLNTSRGASARPPWIYGRADARFTLIEYADLECPYCREYFPVLRHWIDTHPEVNWQWHHLPLPIHDPAATQSARLVECAGETGGNSAFWNSVAWIYQHTRGNGEGLPPDVTPPGLSPALGDCLKSGHPDIAIRTQANAAAHEQISAAPTLRLIDHQTGKTLTLQGSVDGDALLSALDLLASSDSMEPSEAHRK